MKTPQNSRKNPDGTQAVYTTGEVARRLHVAPRTVSKWIDKGLLKGYRLPNARFRNGATGPAGHDRRVRHEDLVAFLAANNLPQFVGATVLVLAENDIAQAAAAAGLPGASAVVCDTLFDLGCEAIKQPPAGVIIELAGDRAPRMAACRRMLAQAVPVVAVAGEDDSQTANELIGAVVLRRPLDPAAPARVMAAVLKSHQEKGHEAVCSA